MPDSPIISLHDSKRKDTFFSIVDGLFLAGCLLSLAMVLINPDQAIKVFIFSTVLSFPVIFNNRHNLLKNKKTLILPLALFAFGLMQIIWVAIFKQQGSPFTAAYRSYQNGGKTLIFASFVITAIGCQKAFSPCIRQAVNYLIIAIGLSLYGWAAYQLYSIGAMNLLAYRVSLGFEFATGTAYALTFIALLASQAILNLRGRWVIPLYFLHFVLSSMAIVTTQTRAAILVYPILCIALFLLHYRRNHKVLAVSITSFIVLGVLALVPLKSVLEQRYMDFKDDIAAYKSENSNTSIGARFAMQRVGFETGKLQPGGESLEQRSASLNILEKTDPSLSGALIYMNIHLHNEIMDTFSLKGVLGVVLLVLLYASMIYMAFEQKNALLLVVAGAIAVYGLSDLLLYAKGESLSSILALSFALILVSNAKREQSHV